mmetsp:Transcript_55102/g.102027  ORF Transcript_55102/g.102027 Transcript_55102/m.102027 type:complete len:401 (+) Transcript_55102:85-1287(+)
MELECTMDEQEVIVLDNGSGYLKVGFSGEDAPRAVLPTVVATLTDDAKEDEPSPNVDSSVAAKNQALYGEEALRHIGQANVNITRPVQRGEIQSSEAQKDALENLWEHTFRTVLGVEQEELPILIADPLPLGQSAYASRQWVAEVMFEKFKVKSLAIFNTAVLSLYSTGRTRGLVVETGEGLTQAVPVFEGYAIPHAIFKMEVAGWDITNKLKGMMVPHVGQDFAGNPRVMQSLKEKVCSIASDAAAVTQAHDDVDEESKSFELPDGKIIQVSRDIRMGAPEILFGGVGSEPGMQKICLDAINTCDLDFKKDLVKSLVVAGGSSMLPGLAPRLRTELSRLLPADLAAQVDICVDSQRKYAAWIGGSMFASLSTFDQAAITRQEFEDGKSDVRNLVARKTF